MRAPRNLKLLSPLRKKRPKPIERGKLKATPQKSKAEFVSVKLSSEGIGC